MTGRAAQAATVDLSRLGKICGLFSSDHVGERAEAARRADALVRAAGLTWLDLLQSQPEGLGAETFRTSRRREVPMTPGEILARHGATLTGWERGFLVGLIRQKCWSDRQIEVFNEILARMSR